MKTLMFRNYLYLNTAFLQSFIAQIDPNLKALSANMNSGDKEDKEPELEKTDLIKAIMGMKQRGSMLECFLKRAKPKETSSISCEKHLDKYVILKTYFDYINLNRLTTTTDPKMRDFYGTISRRNSFAGEAENDDCDVFSIDNIAMISQKLPYVKELFPFDTFLYAKEVVVLLNNDFLCEPPRQIGYKFNNDYTVVGKVEKLATRGRPKSMDVNRMLDGVQMSMLSTMKEMGFIDKGDQNIFLINPIAIYDELEVDVE
jgi:hypothetical protein